MKKASKQSHNQSQATRWLPLSLLVILLSSTGARAKPAQDQSPAPRVSHGNKEIIDLLETVCRPRYQCAKQSREGALFRQGLAFTDGQTDGIPLPGIAITLPEGAERPPLAAVIEEGWEDDNKFILAMEKECSTDQLDYCAGSSFKSGQHTMCKYCGIGNKCPYNLDPLRNSVTGRGISDAKTIEYILELHNEVRSKIARGWCDQPKAGCMGPLQWDPELARVAQKWADQCANVDYKRDFTRKDPILFHDKHAHRKIDKFDNWQGTGQNVARDIAKGKAGEFDAHKLVGHWFNQILFFDPEGVKAFGGGKQCSAGIGYYTQLVWQDTTHVGCGWTQFQYRGFPDYFENFLVCNYGPAANIWGQPVYDIANDTCNCPCIGCNPDTGLCPANCNFAVWTPWNPWSSCSQTCGGGKRERTRECQESPFPPKDSSPAQRLINLHGSLDLVPLDDDKSQLFRQSAQAPKALDPSLCKFGNQSSTSSCNNHDCPAWSPWTEWSGCSKTCGGGQQSRSRSCELDGQTTDASLCVGDSSDSRGCNDAKCPELSPWGEWSECSKSCGSGSQSRRRSCDGEFGPESTDIKDNTCQDSLYDERACNQQDCPMFTEWTEWSTCSKTCGGGTQSRQRDCQAARLDASQCNGEGREERACNDNDCPSWSEWSEFSSCSVSCGGGQQIRTRQCILPSGEVVDSPACPGSDNEEEKCNENQCPELGPWSPWSSCSVTCGGGERTRSRTCSDPANGIVISTDNPCLEDLNEKESCNENECPVLGPWSDWTECSATCGGGKQSRQRECVQASSRLYCEGDLEEERDCNDNPCPSWSEWSEFGECSVTCGGGQRQRERVCQLPNGQEVGQSQCPEGDAVEIEDCNDQPCPELSPWSPWSECSVSCGGGERTRDRDCTTPARTDNPCMEELLERERCNEQPCPEFTEWSEWSECSESCGGGFRKRVRECVDVGASFREDQYDNPCHGPLEVIEECNAVACPSWSPWSPFSPCSTSCGRGSRSKIRTCIIEEGAARDFECEGDDTLTEICNQDEPCPTWGPWTPWTQCSASCGGGTEKRIRDCLLPDARNGNGTNLHGCVGDTWEMRACNEDDCPVWSSWTPWTECSKSCDGGRRVRVRKCALPDTLSPKVLALFCPGDEKELEDCNTSPCPKPTEWSDWSECSTSCGGGTRKRVRECVGFRDEDGNRCKEDLEVTESCNEQPCPTWTEWTEWTTCSKSCGAGTRQRGRECITAERSLCEGSDEETETCNANECPSLTPWSEWTECSRTCGGGSRRRFRDCLVQRSGIGNDCNEPLEEMEDCNDDDCYDWTEWSEWSPCPKCGKAEQTKIRQCKVVDPVRNNDQKCQGSSSMTQDCPIDPCPTWSEWSPWTDCTTSCGPKGTKKRVRKCSVEPTEDQPKPCGDEEEEMTAPCSEDESPPCQSLWTEWSPWSDCSKTCGGGSMKRSRACQSESGDPSPGKCEGTDVMMLFCNTEACQPNSEWSPWSPWSECSQECGGGERRRERSCQPLKRSDEEAVCNGNAFQTEGCNDSPCSGWSEWTPWSECSKTCGSDSTRTRTRSCETSVRPRFGLIIDPCPGMATEQDNCNVPDCPDSEDSLNCKQFRITMTNFKSFGGRPATNIADCTWDFFGCSRGSKWPEKKPCCKARFDACCKSVMGKKSMMMVTTTTPTTTTATTTTSPSTSQSSVAPPQNSNQNRIVLIDCIWSYNGCVKRGEKSDSVCKEEFNMCSMIAMGMMPPPDDLPTTTTRRPINDIDLPELPDFLKPTTSTQRPIRPINDIDLPQEMEQLRPEDDLVLNHPEGQESNEFLGCLLRLYSCQEGGNDRSCSNVDACQPKAPPPTAALEVDSSFAEDIDNSFDSLGVGQSTVSDESNDQALGGDCRWNFYTCGLSGSESACRSQYQHCSDGHNPDDEICSEVAQNPQDYLVPHPSDCTKFYSCQSLGTKDGGWIAHLMECPISTGFDTNLRICNFIQALPRCQNLPLARMVRSIRRIEKRSPFETSSNKEEALPTTSAASRHHFQPIFWTISTVALTLNL